MAIFSNSIYCNARVSKSYHMSGYNPKHGRDTGPPPPSTQPGPSSYATAARPGYNPRHGYDTGPPPPTTNPTPAIPAQVYVPQPAYAFVPMPNVAYTPVAGTYPAIPAYPTQPVPVFTGTFPVAQPAAGPSFPLWSECMLPSEYCTMHIFNSTATPPWQFGPGDNKSFIVRKVPCIVSTPKLSPRIIHIGLMISRCPSKN